MIEILGKLGFDWPVALANLVNFLIIFYLLKRFLWKPLSEVIANREKTIKEGLDNAERAKGDLLVAEENAKAIIAKAKAEANSIIASAKESGDKIITDAEQKAKEKSEGVVVEAETRIKKAEDASWILLKEKSADLVAAVSEKFIGKKLSGDDEMLVKKLIKEIN